jgi:hypothetical protein
VLARRVLAHSIQCIASSSVGSVLTSDRSQCIVVTPRDYGPGFYLSVNEVQQTCLMRGQTDRRLVIRSCLTATQSISSDAVIIDGPGAIDPAFPIRKAKMPDSPSSDYDQCVTRLDSGAVEFSYCGVDPAVAQMWLDPSPFDFFFENIPTSKPAGLTEREGELWDNLEVGYVTAGTLWDNLRNASPGTTQYKDAHAALQSAMSSATLWGETMVEVLRYCNTGVKRLKCVGFGFAIMTLAHWMVQGDLASRMGGQRECRIPSSLKRVDVVRGTCAAPTEIAEVKPDTPDTVTKGVAQLQGYQSLYPIQPLIASVGTGWPVWGVIAPVGPAVVVRYKFERAGVFSYDYDAPIFVPVAIGALAYGTYRNVADAWNRMPLNSPGMPGLRVWCGKGFFG